MAFRRVALLGVLAASLAPLTAGADTQAVVVPPPFTVAEAGRMQLAVDHHWPLAEAHARLGYLLSYWKQRFHIASEWRGDTAYLSGEVWGVRVRATFELTGHNIIARAEDPGAFWRGRIADYVRGKLKKYMHPTYAEP